MRWRWRSLLPAQRLVGGLWTVRPAHTQVLPQTVRRLLEPRSVPHALGPAQFAFAHRVGMAKMDAALLKQALAHPVLGGANVDDAAGHKRLAKLGSQVLSIFVGEYVEARFPKLPPDIVPLAHQIYTSTHNLSVLARHFGVEALLVPLSGIPRIRQDALRKHLRALDPAANAEQVCADLFHALLGAIFTEKGALAARQFLDAFLFSCSFDVDLLCHNLKQPMLRLAVALRSLRMEEPDYRLLHESGRLSNTSVYVVGVYSGVEKIAEASGPALIYAQKRAAVEALKKLFLREHPDAPRKSDALLTHPEPVRDPGTFMALICSA